MRNQTLQAQGIQSSMIDEIYTFSKGIEKPVNFLIKIVRFRDLLILLTGNLNSLFAKYAFFATGNHFFT